MSPANSAIFGRKLGGNLENERERERGKRGKRDVREYGSSGVKSVL